MRKSKMNHIPEQAEILIKDQTDGLARTDIKYERRVVFKYRGRIYRYLESFDWNRGFYEDIHLLNEREYEQERKLIENRKWNYEYRMFESA